MSLTWPRSRVPRFPTALQGANFLWLVMVLSACRRDFSCQASLSFNSRKRLVRQLDLALPGEIFRVAAQHSHEWYQITPSIAFYFSNLNLKLELLI